ncbi:hypothetical protein MY8738_005407 [Beauveria namnaoensis]
MACVVQDPSTKRHQPRDYLDRLEQRVNLLEEQLREAKSGQVPVPGRESDASWDADFDQSEGWVRGHAEEDGEGQGGDGEDLGHHNPAEY